MKKITFYTVMLFMVFATLGCDSEEVATNETNYSPNFRVTESTISDYSLRTSLDEPCSSTTLIAGQNQDAGIVTVDSDGINLIITYTTNPEWTIGLTHLSIGNCDEQWVPTTGSGNPKIGQFEHSEPHSAGTTEVVYHISLDALDENYCFAAHAEVSGLNGEETAWGEGLNFDGNSWAMYVEAFLSDCDLDAPLGNK